MKNGNENKFVIAIARQYGSGGRAIGKKVAEKLGIKYYDKELITVAAKRNGMSEKVFENMDEKPTNSLLYSLAMGSYAMDGHYIYWGDTAPSLNDKVYQSQAELIKEFADEGSCLFVGRCADYILDGRPNVISVFISADMSDRVARIREREGIKNKTEDVIIKTDKKRANYYSFYTNREWGKADNYDLCLNVSAIGEDKAVDIICDYVEKYIG